jgi:hypothetical protein
MGKLKPVPWRNRLEATCLFLRSFAAGVFGTARVSVRVTVTTGEQIDEREQYENPGHEPLLVQMCEGGVYILSTTKPRMAGARS